jgi:hypothetical protein
MAAGTIGGALISSHSQKSAADQAAATQAQSTAAQLQLGEEALGLNKSIYNSNYDLLSPFVSRGNVAGDAINALLGLPSAPVLHSPLAQGSTTGAGTGTSGGSGAAIPASIMSEQSDGIPGNYQADMTTYYMTHPPTSAQLAAMQNDGIPGNYQAALAAMNATGSNPPTLAQIQAMQNDGIPHNYASAMAAYNAPQPATSGTQSAPVVSQTPVSSTLQQQAQQAIAAGADPAAVNARLAQMQAASPAPAQPAAQPASAMPVTTSSSPNFNAQLAASGYARY